MAIQASKLFIMVEAQTDQAVTALNKVSNQINSFANNLGGSNLRDVFSGIVGANVLSSAVDGMKNLGGEAVTAFANYERLGMSLTSLTARELINTDSTLSMTEAYQLAAPKAKELQSWIQKLAIESPFTQEGVATAFRTAQAYGFTSKEAQRLTKDMIDFSSGSGASEDSMGRIALALGQIQSRGRLAGQEVLQLTEAGLPVTQILAEAFGKTTAEIQALQEQGLIPAKAAIEAILQSMEKGFGGAASKQANSFSGLISSLSDVKQFALIDVFSGMAESVRPYLQDVIKMFSSDEVKSSLQNFGRQAGQSFVQIAEGAKEAITWFTNLDNSTRSLILTLGGFALVGPTIVQVLAGFATSAIAVVTTFMKIPAVLAEMGAAIELLKGGASVFGVLSLGGAAAATVLLPVAAAVAAVAGGVYLWNKNVVQVNDTWRQTMNSGMTTYFQDQVGAGKSATEIIAGYRQEQDRLNADLQKQGKTAIFAPQNDVTTHIIRQMGYALTEVKGDYRQYAGAVMDASIGTDELAQKQRDGILAMLDAGESIDDVIVKLGGMQQATFEAMEKDYGDAGTRVAKTMGAMGKDLNAPNLVTSGSLKSALDEMSKPAMDAKTIIQGLGASMKNAGASEVEIKDSTDALAIALGMLTPEQKQLIDNTQMLTDAFSAHAMSQDEYTSFMKQASEGTLALSSAQASAYQNAAANAQATREAAQAASDAAASYWGLAEALKGAYGAQLGKAQIDNLKTALENKQITPEQYNAAVKDIAEGYGLVDKRSMALAENLPKLTDAMAKGLVPTEKMKEALDFLSFNPGANIGDLIKKFGDPEAIAKWQSIGPQTTSPTGPVNTPAPSTVAMPHGELGNVTPPGGQPPTSPSGPVTTPSGEVTAQADKAAADFKAAFSKQNWASIGMDIDKGVAAGIASGSALIIAAAQAAARAAYEAAKAELQISSPSKVFAQLGLQSMAGFAAGISGATRQPVDQVAGVTERMTSAAAVLPRSAAPGLGNAPGSAAAAIHFNLYGGTLTLAGAEAGSIYDSALQQMSPNVH